MSPQQFTVEELESGMADIDALCESEYRVSLDKMMSDDSLTEGMQEARLARLIGVMLKKPFGDRHDTPDEGSPTGSAYLWHWKSDELWAEALTSSGNRGAAELLQYLKDDSYADGALVLQDADDSEWYQFTMVMEHERGLFKAVALWSWNKVRSEESPGFREMVDAPENSEFSLALDAADHAAVIGIASALAVFVPFAGVAIGIGIFVSRYGYRKYEQYANSDQGDISSSR